MSKIKIVHNKEVKRTETVQDYQLKHQTNINDIAL